MVSLSVGLAGLICGMSSVVAVGLVLVWTCRHLRRDRTHVAMVRSDQQTIAFAIIFWY